SEFEQIVEYFSGINEEFKAKRPNEQELILEQIGVTPTSDLYTLAEIKDDPQMEVDFAEAMGNTKHEAGFSGTGGGSSDWAASAVTAAHKQMRQDHPHWGDNTTLHHKISRNTLNDILKAAEQDRAAAQPLFDFLKEVKEYLRSTAGDKKAFHNMPANLEMGPLSEMRRGDPGSGTDFNHTPSGAMTPRSDELNGALSLATRSTVDWNAVADKLRAAQHLHETRYGGAILSPPDIARWERLGDKWKKTSD
ncbi:hypothetical protein, partial [Streptomyces sp. NPDC048611]|uniref:hypothetical protein n=1 Tax=Streptomyces sp. NPDC048611 TaxID=3155635 RepID=UPI0034178237